VALELSFTQRQIRRAREFLRSHMRYYSQNRNSFASSSRCGWKLGSLNCHTLVLYTVGA
jgi:hypothetical protein